MYKFLNDNSLGMRLARTVVQTILGFVIDNAAMIVAQTQFDATTQALIVSLTITVLTPIMKMIGERLPEKLEEVPEDLDIPDAD